MRGVWLDVVRYDELAQWEPDVHWCDVCNDSESEGSPGGLYIQLLDASGAPLDGEVAAGAGRCERCQAVHVRCACGTTNAFLDEQHGQWLGCEGGCGREWRVDIALDRKGIPTSDDLREVIEFR